MARFFVSNQFLKFVSPHFTTMARRNNYLDSLIPYFYQRQTLDVMAYTYISTCKDFFPSITLEEAAVGFMKRYNISEDLMSLNSIIQSFNRTNKDYIDGQKEKQPGGGK